MMPSKYTSDESLDDARGCADRLGVQLDTISIADPVDAFDGILTPHFEGKAEQAETTAFRNGTLQGGYFMIAARAVGLDVGPMSGFSNKIVDEEFFAGSSVRSNFLCNIGYADVSAIFQKLPRFDFDDVCEIL